MVKKASKVGILANFTRLVASFYIQTEDLSKSARFCFALPGPARLATPLTTEVGFSLRAGWLALWHERSYFLLL